MSRYQEFKIDISNQLLFCRCFYVVAEVTLINYNLITIFLNVSVAIQGCNVIELFPSISESDDICIVERLFSSSLVAIVSLSSPRKLKVCHFKKGTEICNYSYSNTILAVRLNRLVRFNSFIFWYQVWCIFTSVKGLNLHKQAQVINMMVYC